MRITADEELGPRQEEPLTWGIDQAELANLWHISAVALSASAGRADNKYRRKVWAADQYSKSHPGTSSTAAYKVLDRSPWTAERGIGRGRKPKHTIRTARANGSPALSCEKEDL